MIVEGRNLGRRKYGHRLHLHLHPRSVKAVILVVVTTRIDISLVRNGKRVLYCCIYSDRCLGVNH